jgi:putative transposase
MRPSKFTNTEIVESLQQVSAGVPAVEICRRLGITQTTFYRWKKKHEVAATSDQHEMRALRDENHRLKEMVANLLLGKRL